MSSSERLQVLVTPDQRRAAARALTERRVEALPPERIDELLVDRYDVDFGAT